MSPPIRIRQPTGVDSLEWLVTDDGSRTLFDARLNETFHSGCGAVAETLIVYLLHSGVLQQLRSGTPCRLIEYGLGTATGLLLTAALAEFHATPLIYYALEYSLLPATLLDPLQLDVAVRQCIGNGNARPARGADPRLRVEEFNCLPTLIDALKSVLREDLRRPAKAEGGMLATTRQLSQFVELRLLVGDIRQLNSSPAADIVPGLSDAIYFDPFSPETNPDLWSPAVFRLAGELLKPSGRLTSYCVKSSVRRDLRGCGFEVTKVPGPVGGKREVLCAIKKTPASNQY